MDNKTMQKVINGISEKLEKFIDSIDKKFDLAGDLFKKLQNQIKDLKSEDLEIFDIIKDLSIRIDDKIYSKIAVDGKIEVLEQYAKDFMADPATGDTEVLVTFEDEESN